MNSIRRIQGDLDRYSRRLNRSFKITGPQLGVMRVVHHLPTVTMGQLSRRMYLHISTVSGIVDRLEAGGYLRRRRSPQDRRVVHLQLSVKGKRTIAKAPPSGLGLMVLNLEKLPAAELGRISRAVQALLQLMDVEARAGRDAGLADIEFDE